MEPAGILLRNDAATRRLEGLDREVVLAHLAQHPVLGLRGHDPGRLERVHAIIEAYEAHDVAADAVRHLDEARVVPLDQREVPRQIEEVRVTLLRHDLHTVPSRSLLQPHRRVGRHHIIAHRTRRRQPPDPELS